MDIRNYQIAKEAYALWRGGHHKTMPPHWDDLGESLQDAFAMVAGHAQIATGQPDKSCQCGLTAEGRCPVCCTVPR